MPVIETALHIDAPPALIWQIMTDFSAFEKWNPMVVAAAVASEGGKVEKGAPLRISVALRAGRPPQKTKANILVCEHEREIRWGGGVPGLLWVEHWVALAPEGAGTRVVHCELFRGLLARPGLWLLGLDKGPYERMNEALKQRAESAAGSRPKMD